MDDERNGIFDDGIVVSATTRTVDDKRPGGLRDDPAGDQRIGCGRYGVRQTGNYNGPIVMKGGVNLLGYGRM